MNPFKQYAGLRRELYILFWGRVVTSMGALIWPMLTLILKNKLGFTASQAAGIIVVIGLVQLPCTLIGGKLADRFSKKNIIILCDLVTVAGYILCGILPMSPVFLVLFCVAGIFAHMEWPAYDALVADLSDSADRERAYSLNYLGSNLGLILAPTLGGFLFENHLSLAFIISGVATFSSTLLIMLYVKDVRPANDHTLASHYEQACAEATTRQVLFRAPVLLLYVLCAGLYMAVYSVGFNFLMPLNMELLYGAKGAVLFGTMTSVNGLVVILGTPLCTTLLARVRDTGKLLLGQGTEMVGFLCFIFGQGRVPLYYLAMVIFTLGEVMMTLGEQPYLTRRVPASHRGRMGSLSRVFSMGLQAVCLYSVGGLAERLSMPLIWTLLVAAGAGNLVLLGLLRWRDKKRFGLLYQTASQMTVEA